MTECDLANIPLEDEILDVAVFSLSLMRKNFQEYLFEAHRTLKLDGQLHIVESTSRFYDREQFAKDLRRIGFKGVEIEDMWKFTYVTAQKSKIETNRNVKIQI